MVGCKREEELMNETLEVIASRYTCRDFSDRVPDDTDMRAIVQAGIAAPSGMNRQSWHFAVVKNAELINEMEAAGMAQVKALPESGIYERIQGRGGKILYNAPCMIVIAIDETNSSGFERVDLGIAAENIVLAATSLGLASCHHGLSAYVFQGEKGAEFAKRLQFPAGYQFGLAVLLGYEKQPGVAHEPDQNKVSWID